MSRQLSAVLNIFETKQLQIGNLVECLVTNSVHTADMDKTRQFVMSVSAM